MFTAVIRENIYWTQHTAYTTSGVMG